MDGWGLFFLRGTFDLLFHFLIPEIVAELAEHAKEFVRCLQVKIGVTKKSCYRHQQKLDLLREIGEEEDVCVFLSCLRCCLGSPRH